MYAHVRKLFQVPLDTLLPKKAVKRIMVSSGKPFIRPDSLICGLGAQQFNKFCESLDLVGMDHKTFQKKADKLYQRLDVDLLEEKVFSEAVRQVRQIHATHNGMTLSDDDVLDISVSYDGSWLTRGHSSHIGIGCAVV